MSKIQEVQTKEVHTEIKLIRIVDENDNPLRLELTGSGLKANSYIGVYVNNDFMIKAITDSNGNINEKDLSISSEKLVDFTALGGFGLKLRHEDSALPRTGVIAEQHAGSLKLDVRYV